MTSDPFKLMSARIYQDMRDEASRHRLLRAAHDDQPSRLRRFASRFVELSRTTIERRGAAVPASADPALEYVFVDRHGDVCCRIDAPDRRTAERVHREAHQVAVQPLRSGRARASRT